MECPLPAGHAEVALTHGSGQALEGGPALVGKGGQLRQQHPAQPHPADHHVVLRQRACAARHGTAQRGPQLLHSRAQYGMLPGCINSSESAAA